MAPAPQPQRDAFLALVRKACPPGLWSQGVNLVRAGAVTLSAESGSEATLRVKERGRAVSPTVVLYLEDGEWACDCESRAACCSHAAAAAIAFAQGTSAEQAPQEGGAEAETATAAPAATLGYRLGVQHGALQIDRVVRRGGSESPLPLGLADRIARGITEPPLDPTHDDLTIDRLLIRKVRGDVPLDHIKTAMEALVHAPDVQFRGQPVRTSAEPVFPAARVEDARGGGATLSIVMPEGLEIVALGTGLVNGTLRPLAETARFGLRFEKLPLVRTFAAPELGSLAAEVLPELERTMEVDVRTSRIPRRERKLRPRVTFELTHELGALHVLPLIVYGEPPVARVDAGKLVMLPQKGGAAPVRDEGREHELALRLRDELSLVPGRRVRYDGGEAARFAAKLEVFQRKDPTAKASGDMAERRELVVKTSFVDGVFDVTFELPTEEGAPAGTPPARASAAAVAEAYREGLSIVGLEGGGFAHLPLGFLERHGQLVLDLISAKDEAGEVPRVLLPLAAQLFEATGAAVPPSLDKALALVATGTVEEAPLASDLRADLRPYQRQGASWIAFLRDAELGGGVLADDMGLGKTVQVLSVLSGRTLVVCPKSVVHNWASEIAKFRPGLRVARYEGAGRALDPDADVTLATYGVLRLDTDALGAVAWDAVVLDEAQAIKNPDSQVSRAAFGLRARLKLCLTGTPVENRLEELWSLLRFAAPGLLGGRRDFAERYAAPIERGDTSMIEKLRARTRPFVLRRTKAEVLKDLPPRTESVLYCELSEAERATYDAVRAATKKEVVERLAEGGGVLAALEALLRLRQASCHSGLLPGQEADTSAKVERLLASLEELAADGHRALVFSQWTSLLDRIEPHLEKAGLAHLRLDGSTRDRGAVTEAFQSQSGPPVLLLSLKAGGTGLNLTAADHVFLLDPWWNPAVEEQAADRAHRIGQDKPVMVFRLVAKDTVEERILALQEKKRALAAAAVGEGGGAAAGITKEDLLALLD
jgi:superfamily II DNA or RNA helicase